MPSSRRPLLHAGSACAGMGHVPAHLSLQTETTRRGES
ncbi:hypothetical protein DFO74_13514 [Chromohalobacter israelensis]|nr:hypothetical protein DFO74_13514 [Chromohalobacter salexigens]